MTTVGTRNRKTLFPSPFSPAVLPSFAGCLGRRATFQVTADERDRMLSEVQGGLFRPSNPPFCALQTAFCDLPQLPVKSQILVTPLVLTLGGRP